ncbi:hypothetical protein TBR22_A15530 [Luteitalea sp. TBR-22]|uniref:sialidase family protein n=1 Tax=Luteitalea sp. TBR-22 TaxID=2802971 RepID=UPI001AF4D72E|nr:sialidase family protein [Luteitalea sp. TBR-22]BCS32343.1 hypothetical protein TBR22_A15530 [Luteitalea sp. TBR-22]
MLTSLLALLTLLLPAPAPVPGTQPQLATRGDEVVLVVARGTRVGVLRSTDAGRTFAEATAIEVAGHMSAGRHRGPRVTLAADAIIVTLIAGAQGGGKDGDVLAFRSTDHGRTWSGPEVINDVPGAAREGLHGMAARPDGTVLVTWLDLREKGTRLYGAVSDDQGRTWRSDTLVYASPDTTICQCCHPSVAGSATGFDVLFRNHIAGNRDMYVTTSPDGRTFAEPVKQGTGTWHLDACPMDGGGLADGPGGRVSTWRREDRVYLTSVAAPEQALGVGKDPAVGARADAGPDVAFIAANGRVVLQRGTSAEGLGPGAHPVVAAFPAHTLVAFEQAGAVVTRVVPR